MQPPTPIRENLALLLSDDGYLNAAAVADWQETDPEVPAAALAAAVTEILNRIAENDRTHAGPRRTPPEQDRQLWQAVAGLLQEAQEQAILAQNRMPMHEDPGDPDRLEQEWQQIERQLAAAAAEAQGMAHYWQGVLDGMERRS